jgi:hypothetical protein
MKLRYLLTAFSIIFIIIILIHHKSREIDQKKIHLILKNLKQYQTFEVVAVGIDDHEVVLYRPYEKGRLVPIPGICPTDEYMTLTWIGTTKEMEQYFSVIEDVIRHQPGVKKVSWYTDSTIVKFLYNFKNIAYLKHHIFASLQYGDKRGLKECFSDSLMDKFRKDYFNIFHFLKDSTLYDTKQFTLKWANDTTMLLSYIKPDSSVVLKCAPKDGQWKVVHFDVIAASSVTVRKDTKDSSTEK